MSAPDQELPSTRQLVRATLGAAVVAAVLLVCVVMPAEYAIDLTGVGRLTGFQRMGEIKQSLETQATRERALPSPTSPTSQAKARPRGTQPQAASPAAKSLNVTLLPDQGQEVKLSMREGDVVDYTWRSSGEAVFADMHADSQALGVSYHGYDKTTANQKSGRLTAAFDGAHGWFWRNRSRDIVVVTLDVSGVFSSVSGP